MNWTPLSPIPDRTGNLHLAAFWERTNPAMSLQQQLQVTIRIHQQSNSHIPSKFQVYKYAMQVRECSLCKFTIDITVSAAGFTFNEISNNGIHYHLLIVTFLVLTLWKVSFFCNKNKDSFLKSTPWICMKF